jgi:hypothetical protein
MRAAKPDDDEVVEQQGLYDDEVLIGIRSSKRQRTCLLRPQKRQKRTTNHNIPSSSHDLPTPPPLSPPARPQTKNGFEWYPGSTTLDILRKKALEAQRPGDFHDSEDPAEKQKREITVREELEDIGFDILDDSKENR